MHNTYVQIKSLIQTIILSQHSILSYPGMSFTTNQVKSDKVNFCISIDHNGRQSSADGQTVSTDDNGRTSSAAGQTAKWTKYLIFL